MRLIRMITSSSALNKWSGFNLIYGKNLITRNQRLNIVFYTERLVYTFIHERYPKKQKK